MALLRSGIYVFFVLAVIVGWVMKRLHSNTSATETDDSLPKNRFTLADAQSALHAANWRVRLQAVRWLAEEDPAGHIHEFISLLDDSDPDVRQTAADALVAVGEASVLPLTAILENGSLTEREMAADALADIGTLNALNALATASQSDESAWVRIRAAKALGETGNSDYVSVLTVVLQDSHHNVYEAAVASLRQIGTKAALRAIEEHTATDK